MCGIAGIVSNAELDLGALAAMSHALEHRGPDGEGFLVSDLGDPLQMRRSLDAVPRCPGVGLAHRRLSIIDLSTSNDQPLVDDRGEVAIAFNGEIYNYRELGLELGRAGRAFRTKGDTEVALQAYAEWGVACFERFAGMWAMAILDRRARRLVLSRDRFGIKPLYWTTVDRSLVFASEIKALLASGLVNPEPHEPTVAMYLTSGRIDLDESTFFSGVKQLAPASTAVIDLDGPGLSPQSRRYWRLPEPEGSYSSRNPPAEVRAALEDSLRLHLRSDVAVGTCLSGGIDSSGIVAVADSLRSDGVDGTFTHAAFGYVPPERELSERPYMDAVAERCSAHLTPVEPAREEFLSALPLVIASQDEPFGSASVAAQWFVFRAARRAGIKVMLDGQGADEVFAGYPSYLSLVAQDLVMSGKPWAFLRHRRECETSQGSAPYPAAFALGALMPARLRVAAANLFMQAQALRTATRTLTSPHVSGALRELAPDARRPRLLSAEAMLRSDVESFNLPALLRYEDRNSMAHSIEARVPYLDHRLVELAFRIPAREHMREGVPKQVLRQALADVLPPIVLGRREKVGFRASPSATWELAQRHRSTLIEAQSEHEARWFVGAEIERLIDSPRRGAEIEFAMWRVINAKLWARKLWSEHPDSPVPVSVGG
jgi:asparagine synthase (glutamine-hydrolysing)